MTQSAKPNDRLLWALFLALGAMWGSSYVFIKIGAASLPPLTLISLRLFFGFLVVATVVRVAREPLPRSRRMYGHLLVMGAINIVLPFALITWSERPGGADSAMAAILNATVPLFVIVLAPLTLPDERITLGRIAGLAIGFIGVIVLIAPDLRPGNADLVSEVALVLSAISYAVGNIYARRHVRGLRPMIPALFQVGFALLISGFLALLLEQPIGRVTPAPEAWFAVLWLGILGSGIAYLFYFRVLRDWGATRTSLVAYLLPVVGIAAGALNGEPITAPRIAGTALIMAGIALVNSRYGSRPLFAPKPSRAPGGAGTAVARPEEG